MRPPGEALPQKCSTSSASSMGVSTLGLRPLFAPAVPCLAPLHALRVVFLLTFNNLRGAL